MSPALDAALRTYAALYIPNADREVKHGGQHGDGIGIIFSKVKPQPEGANGTAAAPFVYAVTAADNAPDWARAAVKGAKPGIRNAIKPTIRAALVNSLLPGGFSVQYNGGNWELRKSGKTVQTARQMRGVIVAAFAAVNAAAK